MDSLTPDQSAAFQFVLDFFHNPSISAMTLYSAAGCGKTFLTKFIVKHLKLQTNIIAAAPTHKACKVLNYHINHNSFFKIPVTTVASLLSKERKHSYVGTKVFSKSAASKLDNYDFVIIDEASMLDDSDFDSLISLSSSIPFKLLFIGDCYQIPHPTQSFSVSNDIAVKNDSKAFSLPHKIELTTIMRQHNNNPLISSYSEIRSAIIQSREPVISRIDSFSNFSGIRFFGDSTLWYDCIKSILSSFSIFDIKIISYTNDNVCSHNRFIRSTLNFTLPIHNNEILMGYNNIGFPTPFIENGQEYLSSNVTTTDSHSISANSKSYPNLVGHIISISPIDYFSNPQIQSDSPKKQIFIPSLDHPNNSSILHDLVSLSIKVNKNYSTKQDFINYCNLKNQLIFMQNVFFIDNAILSDRQFKDIHPLITFNTSSFIHTNSSGKRSIINNKLSNDFIKRYTDSILTKRINDNKPITSSEKLSDRFCVLDKDIDFGYSITCHKSQGSTYRFAFIDEPDFNKLTDSWSFSLGCTISTIKERNQLKYVSYTRAKDAAFVLY